MLSAFVLRSVLLLTSTGQNQTLLKSVIAVKVTSLSHHCNWSELYDQWPWVPALGPQFFGQVHNMSNGPAGILSSSNPSFTVSVPLPKLAFELLPSIQNLDYKFPSEIQTVDCQVPRQELIHFLQDLEFRLTEYYGWNLCFPNEDWVTFEIFLSRMPALQTVPDFKTAEELGRSIEGFQASLARASSSTTNRLGSESGPDPGDNFQSVDDFNNFKSIADSILTILSDSVSVQVHWTPEDLRVLVRQKLFPDYHIEERPPPDNFKNFEEVLHHIFGPTALKCHVREWFSNQSPPALAEAAFVKENYYYYLDYSTQTVQTQSPWEHLPHRKRIQWLLKQQAPLYYLEKIRWVESGDEKTARRCLSEIATWIAERLVLDMIIERAGEAPIVMKDLQNYLKRFYEAVGKDGQTAVANSNLRWKKRKN